DLTHTWETDARRPYLFGERRRSNLLRLPEPNPWIPSARALTSKPYFDLRTQKFDVNISASSAVHIAAPAVIYERERPAVRMWFRQDAKFHRPIVHAKLRLWTAGLQTTSRSAVLTLMYIQLVNDMLQDWSYAAANAGYEYQINSDREGITISLSGYDENL